MRAVVLAGGPGRNMLPLSEDYPKVLLRIVGKPLIDYALSGLERCGIEEYLVVVSDKRVKYFVEERLGWKALVVEQSKPEIEGALAAAAEHLKPDEHFVLAYADIVAPPDMYARLLEVFSVSGCDAALTVVPVLEAETYGIALVDMETNRVVDVYEKPEPGTVESMLALGGAYVLSSRVAKEVSDGASLPEALSAEAKRGSVAALMWTGTWIDVGYPWDIISAVIEVLKEWRTSRVSARAKVSPTAVIEGPVVVEEGAVIDHYAVIKGPVYVGARAFVGKGAFVREFSSLEEDSIAGAFTEVKRSSLQPKSSAGSYVLLADTVLGPGAVVEPGVITMSKLPEEARVKRLPPLQGMVRKYRKLGAYIAPGARVSARTLLGPGSLVFRDGTVRRAF